MKSDISILAFMKETEWTQIARDFLEANFSSVKIVSGSGQGFPEDFSYLLRHETMEIDWVISFLSQWIIPPQILKWAKKGAINFHPGPPEYPGTGCYNFAIWDKAEHYGATCHFMAEKVDTGGIIAFKEFPLYGTETVLQLKQKTMVVMTEMFFEVMDKILKRITLYDDHDWCVKPTTRKDLQKLCCLNGELDEFAKGNEEPLARVLRATYFPNALDAPYITVNGKKWRLEPA